MCLFNIYSSTWVWLAILQAHLIHAKNLGSKNYTQFACPENAQLKCFFQTAAEKLV